MTEMILWLRGVLDEDERVAIVRHDPARVLADIAAKRAILDLWEDSATVDALPISLVGVSRATVHRWLVAAREAGELADPEHRPRHVRWTRGGDSWLACCTCRTPWPCDSPS